jgi:hypothetical protein
MEKTVMIVHLQCFVLGLLVLRATHTLGGIASVCLFNLAR